MPAHFPEAPGSVPCWGRLQRLHKWITGLGHALLQDSSSAQVTFSPASGSPECLN